MTRSPRTPKTTVSLSESISRQLNLYALAATAAGVGLVGSAQPSAAKIVYTPAHQKIPLPSTFLLDLNHDGITDFKLVNSSATSYHGGRDVRLEVRPAVPNNEILGPSSTLGHHLAAALRAGAKVGPKKTFSPRNRTMALWFKVVSTSTDIGYYGQWVKSGQGVRNRYLGLSFDINGKTHFGWARLTVTVTHNGYPVFTGLLTGYAYETIPGKAIIAGKTKGSEVITVQPASLGHLAAGASVIPAWRVRQTAVTTH